MRSITLLLTGLALALTLAACNPASTTNSVSAEDMTLGPANAPVTVIEYASASCSHCARWNQEVFPQFRARYIDTGRVRYVFREYLTPPQSMAAASFLLARCAGRDRYFQVVDAVFRDQERMITQNDIRGGLLRIAQGAGMTEAQFNTCITDTAATEALNQRVQRYEREARITGTPTFVVNGRTLDGEQTLAQLDAAIAQASGQPAPATNAAAPATNSAATNSAPAAAGSAPAATNAAVPTNAAAPATAP